MHSYPDHFPYNSHLGPIPLASKAREERNSITPGKEFTLRPIAYMYVRITKMYQQKHLICVRDSHLCQHPLQICSNSEAAQQEDFRKKLTFC